MGSDAVREDLVQQIKSEQNRQPRVHQVRASASAQGSDAPQPAEGFDGATGEGGAPAAKKRRRRRKPNAARSGASNGAPSGAAPDNES